MVKTKKHSKITNSNRKGGNNQNVIVEIHIGEETKQLKGKINDDEKEELIKKLNEVEEAYNKLQEDKEIVEKAVKINVPVSIPSFPNTTNDKGEILQSIMNMKNKIEKGHEELQEFITKNQDDMDLQFREALYSRGYQIDLTEEEQQQIIQEAEQQRQGGQPQQVAPQQQLIAPRPSTEGLPPPPQVVLPQQQQEIGGRPAGRPAQNIPKDIYTNATKYLQDGTIPAVFGDGKGGVIFNNVNQLTGAIKLVNQGNTPDIVRKAYDRLMGRIAPSQIQQKDMVEEVAKIKRQGEKAGGITDIHGRPVYSDDDSRTPKQQQQDKKLPQKSGDKALEGLKTIRALEDRISRGNQRQQQLLNEMSRLDKLYNDMKSRGDSEVNLRNMELTRKKVREDYNEGGAELRRLEGLLGQARGKYERDLKKEPKPTTSPPVKVDFGRRPDTDKDDKGSSGGVPAGARAVMEGMMM
jgi:hypothetical protein